MMMGQFFSRTPDMHSARPRMMTMMSDTFIGTRKMARALSVTAKTPKTRQTPVSILLTSFCGTATSYFPIIAARG